MRSTGSNAHQTPSASPAAAFFNPTTTLVSKVHPPISIHFLTSPTFVFHVPTGCRLRPCPNTSSCEPAYRRRVRQRAQTTEREETKNSAYVPVSFGSTSSQHCNLLDEWMTHTFHISSNHHQISLAIVSRSLKNSKQNMTPSYKVYSSVPPRRSKAHKNQRNRVRKSPLRCPMAPSVRARAGRLVQWI